MKFELDIKIIQDNVRVLTQQLTDLARKEIAVGVPETAPDKEGVSQAYIAAIHEFGSPKNNIPKRSFLGSTIKENLDKYANIMKNEMNGTIGRSNTSIIPILKNLSGVVQRDVQEKFINNDWQQVSDVRFKQKTKGTGKRKKAGNSPLIDTGELRRSIRGIVRNK